MTDHAELLRRWQRMYNAMDSKHEDKWPKDDDFQKLRQDTHAALAARPVTPAPTLSEAEFTDWFIKNYYGEVVFSDPAWHAKSIYRRARNHASAPEALSERTKFEAWAAKQPGYGTAGNSPDYCLGAVRGAWKVWQAALAAPSTPAAFEPAFSNDTLHSTTLHRLWSEAAPTPTGDPSADLTWQLGQFARSVQKETLAAPSTPAASDEQKLINIALGLMDSPKGASLVSEVARLVAATQAQASDHVADVSKMVAADLSDAEIDALFLQFAEANERGAMWIRTYVEGFRHLARAILAANKGQS